MKISLLVPTRKRPDMLIRMLSSAFELSSRKDRIEVVLCVDEDDFETLEIYEKQLKSDQIKIITQKREKFQSLMWDNCFKQCSGDIGMLCSDDIVFRTEGWDDIVDRWFEKYEDKILYLYARDGMQDGCVGTIGFIHRNWVDAVGYFVPPFFEADACDTWLTEVAKKIKRNVYDPSLYIEHMHFGHQKSSYDETYNYRRSLSKVAMEGYSTTEGQRENDAIKLQSFIDSYKND